MTLFSRPGPQPWPSSDSPSEEHVTSDFRRPDPLSRPASSFPGHRARPGSLFRVVVLLLRGGPSRANTTGLALGHGDRDTRSGRSVGRLVVGLKARECKSGTSARDQLSASAAQVTASPHDRDTPTPAGPRTGRQRRTAGGGALALAWRSPSGQGTPLVLIYEAGRKRVIGLQARVWKPRYHYHARRGLRKNSPSYHYHARLDLEKIRLRTSTTHGPETKKK